MSYLKKYFKTVPAGEQTSAAIAYMASLDAIQASYPEVAQAIVQELKDQRSHLKLIASENFSSLPVQLAMGNLLTDKYSEGIVGHRFYAGCENVDTVEASAVAYAKKIFDAEHAYVQPHSGADANLVAIWAILVKKIQTREMERLGKKISRGADGGRVRGGEKSPRESKDDGDVPWIRGTPHTRLSAQHFLQNHAGGRL